MKPLLLLLLLVVPRTSPAATLTVAASGGGDCPTITACLARASGGDVVLVQAGIYAETFPRTIPAGVTLRAAQPGTAVIQPPNSCGNTFVFELNAQEITLDGLVSDARQVTCGVTQHIRIGPQARRITIVNMELMGGHNTGAASNSHGITFSSSGLEDVPQGITIRQTRIHDIGLDGNPSTGTQSYGIYAASSGIVFEQNEVYRVGGWGVHMYCTEAGGCNDNVFRNNLFRDNRGGILWASGGSRNQFVNNLVLRTGLTRHTPAIQVGGIGGRSQENVVRCNVFYDNRSTCIQLGGAYSGTQHNRIEQNICYRNDADTIALVHDSGSQLVGNVLGQDPGFRDAAAGDFSTPTQGPCGTPGPTGGPDLVSRPPAPRHLRVPTLARQP